MAETSINLIRQSDSTRLPGEFLAHFGTRDAAIPFRRPTKPSPGMIDVRDLPGTISQLRHK